MRIIAINLIVAKITIILYKLRRKHRQSAIFYRDELGERSCKSNYKSILK